MQPQVTNRLEPDVRAQVSALVEDAARVDGTPPLSEQFLLNLRGSNERDGLRHVLAAGTDGVSGYAQLDDGYAELVVHPDARGRGVGGDLAAALESLVGPADVAGAPRVWAHGDLPAAARLAQRRGYRRDRVLWQMRRPLHGGEGLPDVHLPDGVTLRSFVPGRDDDEFLRVNNAAFDWHPEQGGWTRHELDERMREEWFDPAGFLLAVDTERSAGGTSIDTERSAGGASIDTERSAGPASSSSAGRLLGYHWTKVHPATADEAAIGEVYVLGVDPAAHGRGLGRALTLAGLRHLDDRGLGAVLLYVEADNGPAVRVYERLGFTVHAADVNYAR